MDASWTLVGLAAGIGAIHTLAGPDHYVPFLAMSKAARWSQRKTLWITALCGLGHVLGSVILGLLGLAVGWAVGSLEWFESARGQWAGWLLLVYGLLYLVWGVRHAWRNRPHTHVHVHADGKVHAHEHVHKSEHVHLHEVAGHRVDITPWVLFTVFVFGPCEPLIPLLMVPAAMHSYWVVGLVTLIFAVCTIATMTIIVWIGYAGLDRLKWPGLTRYAPLGAGLAVTLCGVAMTLGF